MIEVEFIDRRMDAGMELRFRYASTEVAERMVGLLTVGPVEWGSLTLGGLTFDVMATEVEIESQFEGDVLKVECRLRPAKGTT